MCRDFQIAAFVSEVETESCERPRAARCWFTSSVTRAVRSWRSVPQSLPGVQSPTAARAGAAVPGTLLGSTATMAATAVAIASVIAEDRALIVPPCPLTLKDRATLADDPRTRKGPSLRERRTERTVSVSGIAAA